MAGQRVGVAGGSAQREYDRRRTKDRAVLVRRWPLFLAITMATPVAVYVGVRWGAPRLLDALLERLPTGDVPVQREPTDGEMFHLVGLVMAFAATLRVAQILWGGRRSTEAWGKGAAGERMTERRLRKLPSAYDVHHDLRIPGSVANIDHLVVGPTGAFTIETKHYGADVVVGRAGAVHRGRSLDRVVQQARRQAAAASSRLGVPVQPVVVVHGGVVRTKGWAKPVVDGVRFVSAKYLVRYLRRRPACGTADVDRARQAAKAWSGIAPGAPAPVKRIEPTAVVAATPDACPCGGRWVERRRRRDDHPFLGCSEFPRCRQTRTSPV